MSDSPPEIRSTPYMAPMHQYGSAIMYLTNPENELFKMELAFRGQQIDKEGNIKEIGDPLMNEVGIQSVLGTVQATVNQVGIMSNLSKQDITILMDFLGDTLAKDLMMNRVTYNMTNPSARDRVFFIAISLAFETLRRAEDHNEKTFWKGSQQEITTRIMNEGKKGGLLSALNPWKK